MLNTIKYFFQIFINIYNIHILTLTNGDTYNKGNNPQGAVTDSNRWSDL